MEEEDTRFSEFSEIRFYFNVGGCQAELASGPGLQGGQGQLPRSSEDADISPNEAADERADLRVEPAWSGAWDPGPVLTITHSWLAGMDHDGGTSVSNTVHACSATLLCPTLCDPMDCSPLGSPVHGISQERILEWVAITLSRGSSWPKDRARVSCISCIDRWML